MSPLFSLLQIQVDPANSPVIDMTGIGHTMVFLAIMIGVAGVGFRILFARRRRAMQSPPQPQYAMPWQPPGPPVHAHGNSGGATEATVFCPRCGVRGAAGYCVTCGYDLNTVMRQVHEQFTGNRA